MDFAESSGQRNPQRPYVWDGTEILQVALRFSGENGCNQCRKIEEV
jgi:hypothetical protein